MIIFKVPTNEDYVSIKEEIAKKNQSKIFNVKK